MVLKGGRMHVRRLFIAAACLWSGARYAQCAPPSSNVMAPPGTSASRRDEQQPRTGPAAEQNAADDDFLAELLTAGYTPIDLASALRLAGEENPAILVAQERVIQSVALRQLAAAQFLPTLNAGMNLDSHTGVLQQSSGNILNVRREALFVGAGANAIAAGTVNIPGVVWSGNVSDAIYSYLLSRRAVERSVFAGQAVEQDALLEVAIAYNELVRAEEARSIALQDRNDAGEISRLTAAYLKARVGRKADADRAATELAKRDAAVVRAVGDVGEASARLCKVLHLDSAMRLHATDIVVIPRSVVPDPIPLRELLGIAVLSRPELHEQRVAIAQAMLSLERAQMLPFSPTVLIGFSAGNFGGGSNLVAEPVGSSTFARGEPRFGAFSTRQDFDVLAYWTLQNMGIGNKALIEVARSQLRRTDLELVAKMDQIRTEVANAYAKTHARFAQIRTCELAVRASSDAFREDVGRIIGHEGIPLEATSSLRLLARARSRYADVIVDYNTAQFELYVALGKPPADVLVRPADDGELGPMPTDPPTGVPPSPR